MPLVCAARNQAKRSRSRRLISSLAVVATIVGVASAVAAPSAAPARADSSQGNPDGTPSPEAVALAQAAESGEQIEVVADREDDSTTYANPDGTLSTTFTEGPTRVAKAGGGWASINENLKQDGNDLVPTASPVDVTVSGDGAGPLGTLDTDAGSVGLGWSNSLGDATAAGPTATYADSSAVAVQVTATEQGFSQNVILSSAPTSAPQYVMPLHLNGLTPSLSGGVLTLTGSDGSVVAATQPLRMWDAQVSDDGTPSHVAPVTASLETTADGWSLVLSPSMDYLTDASTQYPVTVDPTIVTYAGTAVHDVAIPNDGTAGSTSDSRLMVGAINRSGGSSSVGYRSWIKFNIGRFIGTDVVGATLNLYQVGAGSCTDQTMRTYAAGAAVSSPYTDANYNAITYSEWQVLSSFNSGGTGTGCTPNGPEGFDVGKIVAGWTSGSITPDGVNYPREGFWLQGYNDTSSAYGKVFCSLNVDPSPTDPCAAQSSPSATHQPQLTVTWNTELGSESWYSMTKHRLNDRSQLMINNDNGNSVIQADDLKIAGRGMNLDFSRYYNGSSTADGQFGEGWVASGGPDVALIPTNSSSPAMRFDYVAPGGVRFGKFVRHTSSDPGSPDTNTFWKLTLQGSDADLKDNNDKDTSTHTHTYTLTFHTSQMRYIFDNFGIDANHAVLTKEIDRNGNEIHFGYDLTNPSSPIWTSITDTHNRTLNVCHNTDGFVSSIRESDSCSATSPTGRVWSYSYGRMDQLQTYTDPMSAVTTYTYVSDQINTINDPAQHGGSHPTTNITYSSQQTTKVSYQQDATHTFDFTFLYTARDDASQNTADSRCHKSGDSRDASYSTTVTDTTDSQNTFTIYCFTDRDDDDSAPGDRELRTVDGLGHRRTTKYNPDQQATTATNATGDGVSDASTVASYNTDGMLQQITDPKDGSSSHGATEYAKYPADSDVTGHDYLPKSTTDAQNICTSYDYNGNGDLTDAWTGMDGGSGHDCSQGGSYRHVQAAYDSHGMVTVTRNSSGIGLSQPDNTYYYYYTTEPNMGSLQKIVRPGGNATCTTDRTLCTTFTYDSDSRVATMTDGNGNTTTYSYDADDRVTQVLTAGATSCTLSAGTCIQYQYDAEGNLFERDDVNGTTSFHYDLLNRLDGETLPDSTTLSMTYDGVNNLKTYVQTLPSKSPDTTTYGYDAANNQTSVTDVNGSFTASYYMTYTDDGQLNVITFPTSPTVTVDYDYTQADRMKTITPSGTGTGIYSISYNYDDTSGDEHQNVQSMTTNSVTTKYSYATSSGGRLTDADASTTGGNHYAYSWDYDGSLQQRTVNSTNTYYGYNEDGELCYSGPNSGTEKARGCPTTPTGDTAYSQDLDGNNTGTTAGPDSYNAANQATSLTAPTGGASMGETYLDQSNDLRIKSVSGGGDVYKSTNGPLGVTARQVTPSGSGTQTTYYTRDNQGHLLGQHGGDGTAYYYTDRQHSTIALIKTDGSAGRTFTYDPMGGTTMGSGSGVSTVFRWDGGYQDEVDGFYHFGARYYDSNSHFFQPDPKEGSINDPASLNRFAYAAGDPVNSNDPSGKDLFGDIFGAVAGVVGAVATAGVIGLAFAEPELLPFAAGLAAAGPIGTGFALTSYFSIEDA